MILSLCALSSLWYRLRYMLSFVLPPPSYVSPVYLYSLYFSSLMSFSTVSIYITQPFSSPTARIYEAASSLWCSSASPLIPSSIFIMENYPVFCSIPFLAQDGSPYPSSHYRSSNRHQVSKFFFKILPFTELAALSLPHSSSDRADRIVLGKSSSQISDLFFFSFPPNHPSWFTHPRLARVPRGTRSCSPDEDGSHFGLSPIFLMHTYVIFVSISYIMCSTNLGGVSEMKYHCKNKYSHPLHHIFSSIFNLKTRVLYHTLLPSVLCLTA